MLLKVRRGPREKLQAIIGTNQAKIDDFSDSEEEKVEPASIDSPVKNTDSPSPLRGSPYKSPKKLIKSPQRPKGKNQKHRKSIGVFERVIIQRYLEYPALYMNRKFDIRVFMVILCCRPFFVFASPGYVRVSLEDFTMTNFGKKTMNNESGKMSSLNQKLIHEMKGSI